MSFTQNQIAHARNLLANPDQLADKPWQRLWAQQAVDYARRHAGPTPSLPDDVIAFPSRIQRAIRKNARTARPAPTGGTAA